MKINRIISAFAAAAVIALGAACSSENKSTAENASASASAAVESTPEEITLVYELPEGEAIAFKDGRVTMLDFNADWCVPCKKFRPVFDAAAEKYHDAIDFVSVNMDLHGDLVEQYGVEKFPTIVFVMPDGSFDKHEGLVEEAEFFDKVEEHLSRLGN